MPIFTITYELRAQGKKFDYTPFAQELRKQRCFQIQGTTWLGSFANNATQVHNHFKKLLDKSDSLMVAELFQHFCYTGGATGVTRWLEANKPTPLPGAKPDETLDAGLARAKAQQQPAEAPAVKTEAAKSAAAKPAAKAKAPAKAAPAAKKPEAKKKAK